MGSATSLMLAVFFGAIGLGYIVYGRKQKRAVALFCGIALCVFPYFVSNVFSIVFISVVSMALPFFVRY